MNKTRRSFFTTQTSTSVALPSWILISLSCLALAVACFVFYYPTLHYYFQFDDLANITKYFAIRKATFKNLFLNGSRWISYWINGLFFHWKHFDPFVYRLYNVMVHMATGLLCFGVTYMGLSGLRKQSFARDNALGISFVTGLFFLLHPVQTQTVSYVIQGQLEGMSGLCIISMVALLFAYARTNQAALKGVVLAALAALTVIACGTKETVFVAPILMALADWFFVAQGDRKEFMSRLWLYGGILTLMLGIYLIVYRWNVITEVVSMKTDKPNNVGNVLTSSIAERITPFRFLISQFKVVFHYLWLFVWPKAMSVDYDWKLSRSFFAPDSFFPFVALLALVAGLVRVFMRNTGSLLCFGMAWFLIYIAPRTSIIPSTELMADYKTYLGAYGIYFLFAVGLVYAYAWLARREDTAGSALRSPGAPYICLLALALSLGSMTYQRNKVWSDAELFWESILAKAPNKARAYNNYGVHVAENKSDFVRAIPLFEKAIKLDQFYPDARNNLAVAYANIDQLDRAIKTLQEALAINNRVPEHYQNLGSFSMKQGNYALAEQAFKQALILRPHYGKALLNLGRLMITLDRPEEAYNAFKGACTYADFDNEIGYFFFGIVCIKTNRLDEAITALRTTLSYNPRHLQALLNLAKCYMTTGNYSSAHALYEQLMALQGRTPQLLFNLAEAYFQMEQYDKAGSLYLELQPQGKEFPQMYLRLAACLARMKREGEAINLLMALVNQDGYPPELKNMARQALAASNIIVSPTAPAQLSAPAPGSTAPAKKPAVRAPQKKG